jgi:hypothetical protein
MSNQRYAELLGETIKAMEDRLEAVNKQRVAHIVEAGRLQEEMNAMRADIQALTVVWNRTPSRGKEMGETKPLASIKGFTAAIEYVLKALGTNMSPPEIRDKLAEWGYNTEKYETDIVASIHSVLKRLVAKGSVQEITDGERRKSYQWIKDSERLTQILS